MFLQETFCYSICTLLIIFLCVLWLFKSYQHIGTILYFSIDFGLCVLFEYEVLKNWHSSHITLLWQICSALQSLCLCFQQSFFKLLPITWPNFLLKFCFPCNITFPPSGSCVLCLLFCLGNKSIFDPLMFLGCLWWLLTVTEPLCFPLFVHNLLFGL